MKLDSIKKIIIISDTHIGSIYESRDFISYIYDLAAKLGIKYVFHGGDILSGFMNDRKVEIEVLEKEFKHFTDIYPKDDKIETYAILGNHDYKYIKMGYDLITNLKNRSNIKYLGTSRGSICINDNILIFKHKIREYDLLKKENVSGILNYNGHSHVYKRKDNKNIYIPTLSHDMMGIKDNKPGFLIVSFNNNEIITEHFEFNHGVNKKNEFVKIKA